MPSVLYCIWWFLFQAPLLASWGDEMVFLRRALWEGPGAGLRHQTCEETLMERKAREPVINHLSTRRHCWNPERFTTTDYIAQKTHDQWYDDEK